MRKKCKQTAILKTYYIPEGTINYEENTDKKCWHSGGIYYRISPLKTNIEYHVKKIIQIIYIIRNKYSNVKTYLIGFSWCGPCFWWNLMSSTFSHFEEIFFFNFQYFFCQWHQTDRLSFSLWRIMNCMKINLEQKCTATGIWYIK